MVRQYQDSDYDQLKELYLQGDLYGGVFDEARDGRQKLANKIKQDPESIWVYEVDGHLIGSISIVEDGRVAWLYRYAVKDQNMNIAKELYETVIPIFKRRGHDQIIAYSPIGDQALAKRYASLGMVKGNSYTSYWKDI